METVDHRRSVGCGLADVTYDEVIKAASRRGITVSELVRHYIEEGLSNPTPAEMRRLNDRLSTMEGALKELYEIAVMNWGTVEKKPKKGAKVSMPWKPKFWDKWKKKLRTKGLVSEKTGKTAYEELVDRAPDWDEESSPYLTDEAAQEILRDMWKADGTWTEEEEREYQEKLEAKREPKYTRAKKPTRKVEKPKPKSRD